LFETLARTSGLFTPGGESHGRIEGISDFFPGARGWASNRLTEIDATPGAVETLARVFYSDLQDRDGQRPVGQARMLEKTPKNSLRVPFFAAAWPDAQFIYLYRDPRATLGSMLEAWATGRFITYPHLPGWTGRSWSLLLTPGWRDLIGLPLPEIVAHQWAITTDVLLDDLKAVPDVRALDYEGFVADPQNVMASLSASLDLPWNVQLPETLPYSKTTFTKPAPDKWRRWEAEIERVFPIVETADLRARDFLDSRRI
jgi:hypothetical protein